VKRNRNGKIVLSRIAILHIGDQIKIKYNPANPQQVAVL
jgi:hypothetical protein